MGRHKMKTRTRTNQNKKTSRCPLALHHLIIDAVSRLATVQGCAPRSRHTLTPDLSALSLALRSASTTAHGGQGPCVGTPNVVLGKMGHGLAGLDLSPIR